MRFENSVHFTTSGFFIIFVFIYITFVLYSLNLTFLRHHQKTFFFLLFNDLEKCDRE